MTTKITAIRIPPEEKRKLLELAKYWDDTMTGVIIGMINEAHEGLGLKDCPKELGK